MGAAIAVLVVVGGVFAATRSGSDDPSTDGSTRSDPPPAAGTDAGDQSGATGESGGASEDSAAGSVSGAVAGDATVTLSKAALGDQTHNGGLTFQIDCSAGSSCTITGVTPTGGLSGFQGDYLDLNDFLGVPWQGGDGTWTHTGRAPADCDEVQGDRRQFVTGTLRFDGETVTVESSTPEYDLDTGRGVCFGPGVTVEFTGAPS